MKATRITGVVALLVGGGLALHGAPSQQPGIKRAELQRHDLGVPDARSYRRASSSTRE